VNARDSSGRTALMLAVNRGNLDVLRHLLSAPGCNVNARHREGSSALHFAASLGNEASVRALIDAGAMINCVDTSNNTPLLLAAIGCRTNSASIKVCTH